MKKNIFLYTLLGGLQALTAQPLMHEAKISGIDKSGFYKIALLPSYRQYMQPNLRDVRIYGADAKEVPYMMLSETQLKATSDFIPYPIISQKHLKNYSEIIIHNPRKDTIGNIAFNINNSDAHKYCAMEGSEDLKQWFSVSSSQELSLAYNGMYTNSYKCIYFPFNNYAYFRLLVEDWQAQPLKINSAGHFKNSVIPGRLLEVPCSAKTMTEPAAKKTIVKLSMAGLQTLDRLDLTIIAPRLFKRHAIVYASRQRKLRHGTESYLEPVIEFELNSGSLNEQRTALLDLPHLNEKELLIEIDNKDNQPLDIKQVHCRQLATYLICDFTAGNTYTLNCGNDSLETPEYDLAGFVPENVQAFPEAVLGPVQRVNHRPTPVKSEATPFFETRAFLWLCLVLAGLAIIFFSQSLLKDMNGRNQA